MFSSTIRKHLTFFGATDEEDEMNAARFSNIDDAVEIYLMAKKRSSWTT